MRQQRDRQAHTDKHTTAIHNEHMIQTQPSVGVGSRWTAALARGVAALKKLISNSGVRFQAAHNRIGTHTHAH